MIRTVPVKCLGVDFTIAMLSVDEVEAYMTAMRASAAVEQKDETWRKEFETMQKEMIILASLNKATPAEPWTEAKLRELDPALLASLSITIRAKSGMPVTDEELTQAETGLLVMKKTDLVVVGETKPTT